MEKPGEGGGQLRLGGFHYGARACGSMYRVCVPYGTAVDDHAPDVRREIHDTVATEVNNF